MKKAAVSRKIEESSPLQESNFQMKIHKKLIMFSFSFVLTLAIFTGCAVKSPVSPKPVGEYTWPSPPETPRIKWLTQWSSSDDFKQASLLDVLIGEAKIWILFRPNGVVSDSSGNVYVADSQNHSIFVFDQGKNTLRFLGEDTLAAPIGLAIDNKRGIVFVTDSKLNKVLGLDKNSGKVVMEMGFVGEFKNPSGIVYDETRERVYVSDTKNHMIRVYDKNGKALFSFGKKGIEDGEFNHPSYLALDKNGKLYVVDKFNARVQIFDPDGKFIKKFGKLGDTSGSFSRPAGIGVDSEDHVYVVDSAFSNFQIFDNDGKLLLWIGKTGTKPGEFYLPTGMYIDKEDKIYVSDTFNRRVQVFQYLKGKSGASSGK